jgi:hypothetical protein
MKCATHIETDATALCQSCNRGLCSRCTMPTRAALCDQCLLTHSRSAAHEACTGLIITLMIFAGTAWFFATMSDTRGLPAMTVTTAMFLGMLFAFTHLGWRFLTNYLPTPWFGTGLFWLAYLVLKFMAAYFIGLIVGPVQILQMLNQLRIVSRVKRQIAAGQF